MSPFTQPQPDSITVFTAQVQQINPSSITLNYQQRPISVPLTHCSAAVIGLQPGDMVRGEQHGDAFFILHRLLRQGEQLPPPLPLQYDAQGRLTIRAGKSLLLQTPKGEIRIDSHGALTLRGVDIHSQAERSNTVQGQQVDIN